MKGSFRRFPARCSGGGAFGGGSGGWLGILGRDSVKDSCLDVGSGGGHSELIDVGPGDAALELDVGVLLLQHLQRLRQPRVLSCQLDVARQVVLRLLPQRALLLLCLAQTSQLQFSIQSSTSVASFHFISSHRPSPVLLT